MNNKETLLKRLSELEISDLETLKELADYIIVNKMLSTMIHEQEESNEIR